MSLGSKIQGAGGSFPCASGILNLGSEAYSIENVLNPLYLVPHDLEATSPSPPYPDNPCSPEAEIEGMDTWRVYT